jgi:hypothetical protein
LNFLHYRPGLRIEDGRGGGRGKREEGRGKREEGRGKREANNPGGGGMDLPSLLPNAVLSG